MIDLTCLCGAVHVAVAARPDFIHECNCTLCRKSGARWGYFAPDQLNVTGATTGVTRADRDRPNAELHFCPACGSTTHFVLTAPAIAQFGNTMAGANMALAEPSALSGIELRFPDGAAWSGAGDFAYVRPARILP